MLTKFFSHYIFRKILFLLCSIFFVITLTFFLMHLLPGDPFAEEHSISLENLKALHRHYGLDQSVLIQYFKYLNHILHFDLGISLKYSGRSVTQIILEHFPISFVLGLEALFIALMGGISLGTLAALYQNKWQDRGILIFSIICLSFPAFLLATLLQYVFAMQLNIFPVARWGSFEHTVLPAVALALFPLAYILKLTRTNILDVLAQDYILTARSKGLNTFEILYKHVWRNALLAVIAYVGPLLAAIFTGSFVIEKIFGIPGLGQWLVVSITNRDYPVIMGITIFYSGILMICNFLIDCLYYNLDPRLKFYERI